MNKRFFMQWTGILCLIVSAGCTKDSIIFEPDSNTASITKKKSIRKALNFANMDSYEQKWGSLTGTILPFEANARIFLAGDTLMELSLDGNGIISTQEIPVGEYTVDIIPSNYYYSPWMVSNVFVYADSITQLGVITLEYLDYNGGGGGCEIGWGRQKKR